MSLWFRRAPHVVATRVFGVAGFVAVMALAAACEVTDEAHLLSLSGIEPSELTLGDSLRIRGQGFPTGVDCRVGLLGVLWQAGRAPRSVDLTLSARAISGDEVAVVVSREAFSPIDSHATFNGRVSVSFAAAAGASRVSGAVDDVTLDLLRADEDLASRYEQLRRAQRTLGALGIVLEDEAQSDGGLLVRWAREGSVAASAGLHQGDLLTHVGGLRLRGVADLVPAPGAAQLQLRFRPSAHPAERVVDLSLASEARPALARTGLIVALVAAFVIACLLWLAPSPRRLVRFRFPAGRDNTEPGQPSLIPAARTATSVRRLVPILLWPLGASLLWIGLAVADRLSISVHVLVLVALVGAAHLVASLPADTGATGLRSWGRELNLLLLVVAALGCAGLHAGSLTLVGLVERQGAMPWQWFAFKAPPLLLACLVFVTAARRLIDRTRGGLRAVSLAFAIVFAGLGAVAFFGGWQPIGASYAHVVSPAVLGIVAFAAKSWTLMLLLILPQRRNVPMLSTAVWTSLALAGIGLSLLWLRLPIVPAVELTVGYSLCGASVVVAILRTWRVGRGGFKRGLAGAQ